MERSILNNTRYVWGNIGKLHVLRFTSVILMASDVLSLLRPGMATDHRGQRSQKCRLVPGRLPFL